MNKILGVVSVLFIIIMFNSSDIGYMEGFTAPSSNNSNDSSTTTNTTNTSTSTNDSTTTSTTTPTLTDEQKQEIISKLQEKVKNNSTTTTNSSSVAAEGFDIIGTENTIKRGKSSNSIPVNSFMKNSDDVMPFGGSFSDSYSAF